MGKPVEDVKRYGELFWKLGPKVFTPDVWRRSRSRVEMREKKIAEVGIIRAFCVKPLCGVIVILDL